MANNGMDTESIIKKLYPVIAVIVSIVMSTVIITSCLSGMLSAAENRANEAMNKATYNEKTLMEMGSELKYIRSRIDGIADKVGAKK